jgi:tRNA threonylcarbamoyladenosine biosynthesis protein TsaB
VLVLAFDTTGEQGGAGIYRDHRCLVSETNPGPARHYSVTLFEMVDRLLGEARLALRDIELFAVANGPGSFTGIRVGVAAAQGWASALHRPVKGISMLEALVDAARLQSEWAIPILDARRGEFYLALYRRASEHAGFALEGEGLLLEPQALATFLAEFAGRGPAQAAATGVVREHDRASQALKGVLPASFCWQGVAGSLVEAIARLALRACREGRLQSPAELDACYIRRSDAEIFFPGLQVQKKKA